MQRGLIFNQVRDRRRRFCGRLCRRRLPHSASRKQPQVSRVPEHWPGSPATPPFEVHAASALRTEPTAAHRRPHRLTRLPRPSPKSSPAVSARLARPDLGRSREGNSHSLRSRILMESGYDFKTVRNGDFPSLKAGKSVETRCFQRSRPRLHYICTKR